MHTTTVTRQPKPARTSGGAMAQYNGRQPHFTPNGRKRQALVILGPMVETARRLKLYALAGDLARLCNRRAFGGEGVHDD